MRLQGMKEAWVRKRGCFLEWSLVNDETPGKYALKIGPNPEAFRFWPNRPFMPRVSLKLMP